MSVAALYEGWPRVQAHLVNALPRLGPSELALSASPDSWPVWAIVSHLAGTRVYWLCAIFKEPGAESTPFADLSGEGWEDHLDVPRSSDELMEAVVSTWRIVESCLERWTPEMLGLSFSRPGPRGTQHHTRSSVLTRMVMHDSFHCGEVSMILGGRGLPSLDPWEPIPPG